MTRMATILIVDDTPAGRATLEGLLLAPDHRLAFASNGPEALAQAAALTPDLILLDVMMPGMDGFEVCSLLRSDPHLAEVPIVMVTALEDRDSRLQGIAAGADDFVSKPFDGAELRARVRSITRLNRYRRLLAARTRFEWVVEQSSEGYLLLSPEDKVLYANPQARLYLGLGPESGEPVDKKFLELAHRQYRCEPAAAWAGWPALASSPGSDSRYLVRPESPTAQATWLQVNLLDHSTGLEGQRLIQLRDVTAQVSLQRNIRTFHDAMSHKLRTPLSHIVTSLEMLADEDNFLAAEQRGEVFKMALRGARRLQDEIRDILHYLNVSRSGKGEPGCSLTEFQQIVADAGNNLELAALTVSGLQELEAGQFALSCQAMEWIVGEILENAKKFHPQQSPAVEITVGQSAEGGISLRFSDNGLTLSPEQLAQAWLPYYQGEKYFTGEAAGMGLGLPTVASLVWEVGGTCRLYNRGDEPGVVVELTIPLG